MQIKSVIIDNIHYINVITFNISILGFFFLIFPAEIGVCVLYTRASYMQSNMVI